MVGALVLRFFCFALDTIENVSYGKREKRQGMKESANALLLALDQFNYDGDLEIKTIFIVHCRIWRADIWG